jgi:hypothetical protein
MILDRMELSINGSTIDSINDAEIIGLSTWKTAIEFLSYMKGYIKGSFLKLLEENIRCYLSNFKIGKDFINKAKKSLTKTKN